MSSPIAFESPQACARRLDAVIDNVFLPLQGLAEGLGQLCAERQAAGVLADRSLYMEWRRRVEDGRLLSLVPNLDQRSANCFHYLDAPWFRIPSAQGVRTVAGPYVDLHCTGAYALTFSRPVTVDGGFVGVACVDLPMSSFEPLLLGALLRLRQEALLVSADGRVIASSSPEWAVGDLLAGRLDPQVCSVQALQAEPAWQLWCLPAVRRQAA